MPFTLAHPAAVMPLRRFNYLPTLALIVGSMTPDIPYYFPGRWGLGLGGDTHTLWGSLLLDVPLGLLVIAMALLLRRPLTALMTERARWVSLREAEAFTCRRSNWLLAVPALLVGVWLHILWDEFTHPGTWLVRRVDALSAPVNWFGGLYTGEVSHVLQYVSSIVGLAVIAYWYVRVAAQARPEISAGADRRALRWLLLSLVVVAAVAMGTFQAMRTHHQFPTVYRLIYLLLTRTVAWFIVLYLAVGSLFLLTQRPQPQQEPV
jgi:hypothetical protein